MRTQRHLLWLVAATTLALAGCNSLQTAGHDAELEPATTLAVTHQTADVFGQGAEGPTVAVDGATIRRTPNGITMQLSMPTPEPGTYAYPTEGDARSGPGHPEAFTLWAFVFDDPEDENWTGAFFVAGHLVGGPNLTLSGHISTRTEPFGGEPLTNPAGAEVHLAVAPHGGLDPALLPELIKTPTGPGPDIWWLALFDPPE